MTAEMIEELKEFIDVKMRLHSRYIYNATSAGKKLQHAAVWLAYESVLIKIKEIERTEE